MTKILTINNLSWNVNFKIKLMTLPMVVEMLISCEDTVLLKQITSPRLPGVKSELKCCYIEKPRKFQLHLCRLDKTDLFNSCPLKVTQ